MARRKLTPKQERFAQLYIETGNASEAYRGAYNASRMKAETVTRNAHELLRGSNVAARVEELQQRVLKRHDVTVDSLLGELEEARQLAMTTPRAAGAAVSASMGKAKLKGLAIDRVKHEGVVRTQQLPPLSVEASEALLAKIEAEEL